MFVARFLITLLFFVVSALLPQQVFAATTPYRSAGWVGIPPGGTNLPYTNLTGCQTTDGIYCERLLAPGGTNLYFSSFGTLSDFGIPLGSTPNAVHFRATGKGTPITHWIQVGQGRNRPVTQLCQNPNNFDTYTVPMTTTDAIHNVFTVFTPFSTGGNNFDQCFSANNINAQNFTIALFYNGFSISQWQAYIDNFEIAFDYIPPVIPTPTSTPTPTPTTTPTPTPTSTPTPTPTPTPSRDVVFVHGLTSSYRDVNDGNAEFGSLFGFIPQGNRRIFSYYQDFGYKTDAGECIDELGNLQPTPDTNTGSLHSHPDSIDPSICDSQSALAYNSTKLGALLTSLQEQKAIINFSMGAAITRGWLTLAQNRDDETLDTINTIISMQGAYQGSYLAKAGMYLLETDWASPLKTVIVWSAKSLWGIDASRPAEEDLTPKSLWYQSANANSVPLDIHYFNFYSDIQVTARPQLFFITLPPIGTASFGDTVLLPGNSDPTALPDFGGARFLSGGEAEDRHEYTIASNYDVLLGDDILTPLLPDPLTVAGVALDIKNDPRTHFNLNNYLNDDVIKIASCKSSLGQVTIQTEILRILADPAHACDL